MKKYIILEIHLRIYCSCFSLSGSTIFNYVSRSHGMYHGPFDGHFLLEKRLAEKSDEMHEWLQWRMTLIKDLRGDYITTKY